MSAGNARRRALGIAYDAFVALRSGTMSANQGLEMLAEIAQRLTHKFEIDFPFCDRCAGRELTGGMCGHSTHTSTAAPGCRASVRIAQYGGRIPAAKKGCGRRPRAAVRVNRHAGKWRSGTGNGGARHGISALGRMLRPRRRARRQSWVVDAVLELSQALEVFGSMGALARQRASARLLRDAVLGGILETAIPSKINPTVSFSPCPAARTSLKQGEAQ